MASYIPAKAERKVNKLDKPLTIEALSELTSPVLMDLIPPADSNYLPFISVDAEERNSLDYRVFLQGVYWVNRDREFLRIDNMSARYLLNVKNMINNNSIIYHTWLAQQLNDFCKEYPNDEAFIQNVEYEIGILLSYSKPDEWVEDTLLMRAINRRLASLDAQRNLSPS